MGVTKMSKRIEKLEEEKVMEEKDFNLKESSLGDFLNYIRVLAKIEERKQAEKEFLEVIDSFSNKDNLKLSWSDFPIECPICKLDNKCWSRISENPRKEICIYCKIRELKQKITGEEK